MFRFNNPDALLVLLLVAGAYATCGPWRAASTGGWCWAGVLVGFGFLTKMLQALLVVPGVRAGLPDRRADHAAPADRAAAAGGRRAGRVGRLVGRDRRARAGLVRPYIGGSQNNSVLELTLGYNGLGRLTGNETGSVGGGGRRLGRDRAGRGCSTPGIGGQVAWLLPAALILLVAGLV